MNIDRLTAADLDASLALSAAEGWNQTASDWTRILALAPEGCFAARDGERLVGTVTTTTYGRDLAWIGMMIVHPDRRGRGIGAALMRRALEHLRASGIATVKLDATPAGRPLYASLGFAAEVDLERWQGVARADASSRPLLDPASRARVFDLDRAAYGVDRTALLERLMDACTGEPIVIDSGGTAGFVLARPGRAATYLGPLVAADASLIEPLLDAMLTRCAGREVCLDRHALDPDFLRRRGLTPRRVLTRMFHGRPGDAGTSPMIAASAGPEFG